MPIPSSTGYSASNIEISISSGTAVIATDYGTSGDLGFSAAHAQVAKLTWGDSTNTYRVSETYPAPVKLYGITGTTVPVSGTITGTGDFFIKTYPTIPIIIKGSTFTTDAPVAVTGAVQGVANGIPIGVTGYVNLLNTVGMYGLSGGTAIAVTGGRKLNFLSDSVYVYGNVGISGGFALAAGTDSVSVYGPAGSTYIEANLRVNGTPLGLSGDSLKVAVTNTGFSFNVSLASTIGITNDSVSSAIRVQGFSGGVPMHIKGSLAGGAIEIGAYTPVPVGVSGTVEINDTALIEEIDSLKTNIGTVATNAGYALDILNLMTTGSGAKVNVSSISKPGRVIHGQKSVTTTPTILGTEALKTGITLKSPNLNSVDIYIGNSLSVAANTGYILSPGESIYLEVSTLGSLFVRTTTSSATLVYIGT